MERAMNPEVLRELFELNASCVKVNTEGFTDADGLVQPQGGGNCANWVLGHIVATRQAILGILGRPPIWTETEVDMYKRGSAPIMNGSRAMALNKILSDFNRSQDQILEALRRMSSDDLLKRIDNESVGSRLAFFHFHEAYHLGQIGLLRRIVGKEGAIK
jgi:uncharacterized damage-inducible protein DinB